MCIEEPDEKLPEAAKRHNQLYNFFSLYPEECTEPQTLPEKIHINMQWNIAATAILN